MARCGCAGSGCSCRVLGGDGVLVTGSGTPTDPFVISSEHTSFASAFQVVDTASVSLDLVGSGTSVDPFVLTATSAITMEQLSNWDDPAGPNVGDVPVFNGVAWEAAPPATVAPGTVNASGGISGDGTFGDPLVVAVSDDTTTTTSGLAIYVDSAGELRAVPPGSTDVSWDDIDDKPTAFPTTWSTVSGKPTTFAPIIGTSSTTAKRGNWFPTWSEVTGKPAIPVADTPSGSSGYAIMRIGATNSVGLYWNGSQPVWRTDATDFPLATVALVSAVQTTLQTNINSKADAYSTIDSVRYAEGPTANAYARTVSGSGFFAVWMDAGGQFGRNVSARKYKTDIEPYVLDPAAVLALQPVRYTLISSPEAGPQYGLIADDVAEVLPEIVTFENDVPETIRYDLLSVALLDVVRSQQARLDSADRKHDLVLARLRNLEGSGD